MASGPWSRVRLGFERALELEGDGRAPFLEELARNEPDVCAEVRRLLAADAQAGPFLARPVAGPAFLVPVRQPLPPGSRLGPFTIGRIVASGGMGTVYKAVQDEPRRVVALKTLNRGLNSQKGRQRFRFESEVLGRLSHAGIAQVHASGTHEVGGRSFPYFAMEFVEGARDLCAYAGEERLSRRRRIEIFLEVCDALDHAHAKGVIHRDLKAGNVLVNSQGRPKIIDFGIAHVVDLEAEPSPLPVLGLGTPATMSPEHLSGKLEDVDVRSDVYSLGCLLHELLAGRPPRDVDGLPTSEIARRIQEEPPCVARDLHVELRWILAKALAADPGARYAGVAELAADLRRHLAGESVAAAPPRAGYRLRKLAWRHRMALLSSAGVLAALSVGLVLSDRARREAVAALARAERAEELARDRALVAEEAHAHAEDEAAKARATLSFFVRAVESVDPQLAGRSVRLADVLALMGSSAAEELGERPELEAAIRASVGRSLQSIGLYDAAAPHLERAHALWEDAANLGARARSRYDLGSLRQDQGRLDEAEELIRAAIEDWDEIGCGPDADVGVKLTAVDRLGTLHQQRGRQTEAATILERAARRERAPRAD